MERDYFLDAQQALEMGLVDKVLTSREEQETAMAPLKGEKGNKNHDENNRYQGKGKTDGNGDGEDGQPAGPSVNPGSS